MIGRRAGSTVLATSLALVGALLVVAAPSGASTAASDPTRVLVVGDSVAQGSAGDWTWRYRLWEHLVDVGADVDLVGPRTDVYDNVTSTFGAETYADSHFDRDHAARWGMTLAFPDDPLADLVATYGPDVVVETRGLNDFVFLHVAPEDAVALVEREIVAAREVDPEVDVVLALLPQTWYDRATEGSITAFNAMLTQLATSLDSPAARVVAAASGSGFVENLDTWDPAHLSARGEVRFAAAVADALAQLGVGAAYPRPLGTVVNGHWASARVSASAGDGTVALSWVSGPGVAYEWVWQRDLTAREPWIRLPVAQASGSWTASGLVNGHVYAYRLQAAKGVIVAADYSAEVRARPSPPVPGAITRLRVRSRDHGLRLSWDAAGGATSYRVVWSGAGRTRSRSVTGSPLVLRGLRAGTPYDVQVAARNLNPVPGPVARAVGVPAGPRPGAPAQVRAEVHGDRVRLSWARVRHATRYVVAVRDEGAWRSVSRVHRTVATLRGLGPGRQRLRVRAEHQAVGGPWSSVWVRVG